MWGKALLLLSLLSLFHQGASNGVEGKDQNQLVQNRRTDGKSLPSPKKKGFQTAPGLFQRAKRGVEDEQTSSSEEDEDKRCRKLPPKPPPAPQVEINLLNLLNEGSSYMAHDDSVQEANIIMGNTGCGKTTFTQMVAGDLSRLHAVRTESRRLLIIDDDNRIGAPSTISKTLVPELVLKREDDGNTTTAFYDCPGFDDNRGAEQDIAANYFINQIVTRVQRVKFLFLVIHSSVTIANERLDFDKMVGHATRFLRNIQSYNGSFGLVVTKVESYTSRGKPVKDKYIMKGIVEFLQMYLHDLRSQVNSSLITSNSEGDLERKIQFVNVLLEKNDGNGYGRISFSRSPDQCGVLSESKTVSENRNRIVSFYSSGLEYAPVNPEDFGYTLKAETKLKLITYVEALNSDIGNRTDQVMNDFKASMDHQNHSLTNDLLADLKRTRNITSTLQSLIGSSKRLGNESNPGAFLELIEASLEQLGYELPPNYTQFMEHQQNLFHFFDKANAEPINRNLTNWLGSVQAVHSEYKKSEEEAKLALRNHVIAQNDDITEEVSELLEDFEEWHTSQSADCSDQMEKAEWIEDSADGFEKLVQSLETLGSTSYPEDFARIVKPALEQLGFNVSSDFKDFMEEQQSYFEYDAEISPPGVIRTVNDWKEPILALGLKLKGQDEKMKAELANQWNSLNEQVGEGISSFMTEFKVWYEGKFMKTTDLGQIARGLETPEGAMTNLVTSLEAISNLEDFLKTLKSSLEGLGYNSVSRNLDTLATVRKPYVDLFDELSSPPAINRKIDKWIEPIKKAGEDFKNLRIWYKFCDELKTKVGTYDWQLSKPNMPGNGVDWLDFLGWECGIQVGSDVQLLWSQSRLEKVHLDVLGRIMNFALKPIQVTCDGVGKVTVIGNYVRLGEFISSSGPLVGRCYFGGGVKQIEIYAAHTIFIDQDVNAVGLGLKLAMLAPNWVVVGNQQYINLDGSPGARHYPSVAESGTGQENGEDGLAGNPGGPGGSLLGLALRTSHIGSLKISSIGGKGGSGQQGGAGADGGTNRDARQADATYDRKVFHFSSGLNTVYDEYYSHHGFPGYSGRDGGDGGRGGVGGLPGKVELSIGGSSPQTVVKPGATGLAGEGGQGGRGGVRSMGITCEKRYAWALFIPVWKTTCVEERFNYDRGTAGQRGSPGVANPGGYHRSPQAPPQINKGQSIANYKSASRSVDNAETKSFLQFLDRNPTTRSY